VTRQGARLGPRPTDAAKLDHGNPTAAALDHARTILADVRHVVERDLVAGDDAGLFARGEFLIASLVTVEKLLTIAAGA
jgi:hypothetical protein